MNEDPLALLPELCLLGGAVVGLLTGMFLPRRRQGAVTALALVALAAGAVAATVAAAGSDRVVFETYTIDTGLHAARLIVLAGTALVLVLSRPAVRGHPRETEFVTLVLLTALGTVLLAGAADLAVLMAAYLVASIPGYALAGFAKDPAGVEAALKYYLMGALLGITTLTGITVLYGVAGTTSYEGLRDTLGAAPTGAVAAGIVAVIAGLLFKAGAVPAQFWVPDVASGATVPVAALLTTVPKVGGVVAAFRLAGSVLDPALGEAGPNWALLVALVAAASMTLGNLAAFFQDHPRRLLAYSTISQVGYALMGVAAAGGSDLAARTTLYYLAGYTAANLGAFAVVAWLPDVHDLTGYTGLFTRRPWLALTLVVCLLGLVGTPPTAVFVGKLGVFSAAADAGLAWLVVVAAVNTVASLFYYLRWVVPLFRQAPQAPETAGGAAHATSHPEPTAGASVLVVAYAAGAATVVLGLAAGPLLAALSTPLLH